ncbi:hypothetical protein, partial [Escherichia coli]|uniref:hypothetical protein n=1 Tax=Escherichia coli TaxID=562 RepID=UPI0028DE5FD5
MHRAPQDDAAGTGQHDEDDDQPRAQRVPELPALPVPALVPAVADPPAVVPVALQTCEPPGTLVLLALPTVAPAVVIGVVGAHGDGG